MFAWWLLVIFLLQDAWLKVVKYSNNSIFPILSGVFAFPPLVYFPGHALGRYLVEFLQ